jgi:BMFP domain-containing protein YqiC
MRTGGDMNPLDLLKEMQHKVEDAIHNSPAKDLNQHIKTLMNSTFNKLELVTRDEFEVQRQILEHTRQKLDRIEKQLDALLIEKQKEQSEILVSDITP